MKDTPLRKAIDLAGTQSKLAEVTNPHLPAEIKPIGQYTISAWLLRFNHRVGSDYVIAMCKGLDYKITPHQLRPDLYPHPQDGLPDHLREVA